MITIDAQQKLLISISRRLKRSITAYAIGGNAMMFHGLKNSTKDIDLVFENEKDRNTFKEAIISLGYQAINPVQVYGQKNNKPQMFTLGDERFDLFVNTIINFTFSKEMRERAKPAHQFGKTLTLKAADPHDIIIMKCATDRLKDKDDARSIINSTEIKWDIIIKESENQITLGEERASFELGCFLEDMKRDMKLDIPEDALDKLFAIVEKQIKEKKKKK